LVWDSCVRLPSADPLGTSNLHLPALLIGSLDAIFSLLWRFPLMNIYVGNLSYEATEDDIRNAFAQFGQVSSVSVIKDRETGRSKGFAFVEMGNDEDGKNAIEGLNLQRIAGRAVTVNEARPREERSGGGGGRGGRRY
jgi:cold-inducible RNA-binding protein